MLSWSYKLQTMEPGNPPGTNPFDPNQFKPAGDRVKRSHWAVIIIVLVALIVTIPWLVVRRTKRAMGWFHNNEKGIAEGKYGDKRFDTTYVQPFDSSVKAAKLTLNGGTSIYKISDTTNQLFRADAMLFHSRYALNGHKQDSVYEMNLTMKSKSSTQFGKQSDSVNLKLNLAPVWDIVVNSGATDLNFDLSKYRVRNFAIHGSAGSFSVKLGPPLAQTDIKIAVGAAGVTVSIPKNAACRIDDHSAFSSVTYDGFSKKYDGSYETPGFSSSKNKILVHFTGGMADFKVHRY